MLQLACLAAVACTPSLLPAKRAHCAVGLLERCAAGATPADVAAKARHLGVARYLREAAEGRMPANQPTKDAFIERYLGRLSSGADGKAAATNGIQQEGPAESRQLAAAEGGQAAVGGACVGEACKADSLDDKSGGSSAAREPVGASKLAAARKLAKRGFEGWGTQGELRGATNDGWVEGPERAGAQCSGLLVPWWAASGHALDTGGSLRSPQAPTRAWRLHCTGRWR